MIHASKRVDVAGVNRFLKEMHELQPGSLGAIVGYAFLYNCNQKQRSEWHDAGHWGWYLADRVKLREPVPYTGQLSLFDIDISKIILPVSLCTRCRASFPIQGHRICGCCLWYLNESTDRRADSPSKERWLYVDHLSKQLRSVHDAEMAE